jgi:hypothetical protein
MATFLSGMIGRSRMRNFFQQIFVFVPIVCLAGCLPTVSSIHPVFHYDDVIVDDRIAGVWTIADNDNSDLVTISITNDRMYTVDMGSGNVYTTYLTQIGDHIFVDCFNEKAGKEDLELAVHMFQKIEISDNELVLYRIDPKTFRKLAAGAVAFSDIDAEALVLTTPTDQLRTFLADAKYDGMYVAAMKLTRVRQ